MVRRTLSLGQILLRSACVYCSYMQTTLNIINRPCFTVHISRQPHGRCFVMHKPKEFAAKVMPLYFRQSKITSFQRQLNLYGFIRITQGPDRGGYYHELFLRHKAFLCEMMVRVFFSKKSALMCVTPYTFHCNCIISLVFVSRVLA